jgi:hypothetical protein
MVNPNKLIEVYDFDLEYEKIDFNKPHEVLGAMTVIMNGNNEYKEQSALNTFRFGKLINEGNHELNIDIISDIFRTEKSELESICKVVKDLKNDEDNFKRRYKSYGEFLTWNGFVSKLYATEKVSQPLDTVKKLGDLVKIILDHVKRGSEYLGHDLLELYTSLFYIRNIITRYLPPDDTIGDINYLKYYDCCCCGDPDVPEDGYNLAIYKGIKYIKYPICNDCLSKGKGPDPERLVQLYSSYSLILEEYLDRL